MGIWNLIDELLGQESALVLFCTVQHFFIHLQMHFTMPMKISDSAVQYSVIFTKD